MSKSPKLCSLGLARLLQVGRRSRAAHPLVQAAWAVCFLGLVAISLVRPAEGAAVSAQWTGNLNAAWSASGNGTNWTGGIAPNLTGSTAIFGPANVTNVGINLLGAGITVGNLNFQSLQNYTLTGNTLTLATTGGANTTILLGNTTGSLTINAGLTLGNDTTITSSAGNSTSLTINGALTTNNHSILFNGTGTGATTISSNISGSGNIVQSSAGIVTLSGNNSYTGATTITAGTLAIASNTALGSGSPLTVSGGTLAVGNQTLSVGAVTLVGGNITGGINIDDTTSLKSQLIGTSYNVQSGCITASLGGTGATLTKNTTGTVTLGGLSNYTGATTISGGTLQVVYFGNVGNGTLVGAWGSGNSSLGQSSNNSANLVINGTLQYIGNGDSSDRSFTIGNNSATIDASGTGALVLSNTTAIGFTGTGNRTLTLTGNNAQGNTLNAIVGDQSANLTSLVKAGTGEWILGGANTYTGGTTVNGGTLALGASNVLANTGALVINAGGNFDISSYTDTVGPVTLAGGNITGTTGVLTSNSTYAMQSGTVTAILNGTVGLTKSTAGTVTLSANNSYTGVTNIDGGTLVVSVLNNGGVNSSIGSSSSNPANLIMNGTLQYVGSGSTTDRSFQVGTGNMTLDASGSGPLAFTNTTAFTYSSTAAHNLTFTGTNTGNNSFALAINNSGAGITSVTKNGVGEWSFMTAGNYTGATTINGGTLQAFILANGGTNSSLGAATSNAANLVINGGTLAYIGNTSAVSNRSFTLTASGGEIDSSGTGNLTLSNTTAFTLSGTGNRTLTLGGTNSGNNYLMAGITDNGANSTSLVKDDQGYWTVGGTNTFTGNTTINNGILYVGSSTALQDSTVNLIGNSAELSFNGTVTAATLGGLAGNQEILLYNSLGTAVALTVGNNNGNATYAGSSLGAGALDGTGSIIKVGTGTQTFTGVNSYGGSTTINAGTLAVTTLDNGGISSGIGSSNSSAVNLVLNGGTLQYLGTGNSTNHLFTLGASGGTLDASGTGNLAWTNTGAIGLSGAGNRTLTLTGTNTGNNSLSAALNNFNATAYTSLTKAGNGTWTLTGSGNYAGVTTINGGTLAVTTLAAGGTNSSIGAATNAAGSLVINGGTLQYIGSGSSTDHAITIGTGNATLDASGSGNVNFTSATSPAFSTNNVAHTLTLTGTNSGNNSFQAVIADDGTGNTSVVKTGTGTWNLTASSTYNGSTTISSGTLAVSVLANIGTASGIGKGLNTAASLVIDGGTLQYLGTTATATNRLFTVGAGGATLDNSGTGNITFSNTTAVSFTGSGARTVTLTGTNTGNNTLKGAIGDGSGGSTSLTKTGPGSWTLASTANSYTGLTTINGGTLIEDFGNTSATSNLISSSSGLVLGGGTLQLNGNSGANRMQTFANTTLNPGASSIVLVANGASRRPTLATGSITRNTGATLDVTLPASTNITVTGSTLTGNVLTSNGVAYATIGGANWATVSGGNLISTVYAGTATIATWTGGNNVAIGANPSANITANTFINTLKYTGTSAVKLNGNLTVVAGGILVTGTGTDSISGGTLFGSNGTNHELVVVQNDTTNAFTISSLIADNGASSALTKAGTGTLVLSASNTYTGNTTISSGTLQLTNANAVQDSTVNYIGGNLNFSGIQTANFGGLAGSGNFILANITGGALGLTVGSNNASTTYSGVMSGAGNLTTGGTGALTLTGANTYTGNTTLSSGTLNFNNASAFGTGAFVVSGGNLDNTSGAAIVNTDNNAVILNGNLAYNGSNDLNLGTGNVTLTGNRTITSLGSANLTLNGNVGGAFSLTKNGSGELILNAASTYSGGTIVNAGTLSVGDDNALGTGNVTVNNGGTLGLQNYTGPAAGNLTISGTGANGQGALLAQGAFTSWQSNITLAGSANISSGAVDGGIFQVGTATSAINLGSNTLTLTGTGANEMDVQGNITGAGNVIINTTGNIVYDQSYSNTNTYTGTTKIQSGTLILNTPDNNVEVNSANPGLGMAIAGGNVYIGMGTGAPAQSATVQYGFAGASYPDEVMSNQTVVTIYNDGYLNLEGHHQTIAGLNLYGGQIDTGSNGTLYLRGTVNAFANTTTATINGTLGLNGLNSNGNATRTFYVEDGGNATSDLTINARIVDGGTSTSSIVKTGNGTMYLSGNSANGYKGTTTVSAGILVVTDANALGQGGNDPTKGTIVQSGAQLQVAGNIAVGQETLSLAGNGTANNGALYNTAGNTNSWAGDVSVSSNATVNVDTGSTLTMSGVFSSTGNQSLTVMGAGNLTLSGSFNGTAGNTVGDVVMNGTGSLTYTGYNTNGYVGNTTINSGTLVMDKDSNARAAIPTGTTITINAGGTLLSDASNQFASTNIQMTLNGGTWNTQGYSDSLGALTLSSTSTLDLGDGSSVIKFTDSSGAQWAPNNDLNLLDILDWNGTVGDGGGTDQVFFGTNGGGLTAAQLSMIKFVDPQGLAPGTYDAIILTNGEVVPGTRFVPAPEPGTYAAGGVLAVLAAWWERRRRQLKKS